MYNILERSLVEGRDALSTVDGVKNTLSSWDNCMAKSYCKWPVIVVIIVGSLIVLSILFCCIRCLCCGVECCCGICACCNACCPSPRRRGDKSAYNDSNPPYRPVGPPQQPYNAQYQSRGPPAYASPTFNPAPGYNHGRPQYAQFDVSKPSNPDALPSMPSWDGAENRKVEVFDDPSDNVEMNDLDHQGHKPGTADSQAPMMGGFAAGGLAAAHGRPGAGSRADSQDPYGHHPQSPYDQRGSYGDGLTSPYGEHESFMNEGGHPGANGGYHQQASTEAGYAGAAVGGYRGAASPPAQLHSPQHSYHDDASRGASPQFQQYPHQEMGSQQARLQTQSPPQAQQQSYQAFSPNMAPNAAPVASYPGQRTYQTGSQPRSPVSPVSPQHMDYGSRGVEHGADYAGQYGTQQPQQNSGYQAPGWRRSVDRKPVGGSWRDI